MVLAAVSVALLRTCQVVRRLPAHDVLRSSFEALGRPLLLLLWACQTRYRAVLRGECRSEPSDVIADYDVTRGFGGRTHELRVRAGRMK